MKKSILLVFIFLLLGNQLVSQVVDICLCYSTIDKDTTNYRLIEISYFNENADVISSKYIFYNYAGEADTAVLSFSYKYKDSLQVESELETLYSGYTTNTNSTMTYDEFGVLSSVEEDNVKSLSLSNGTDTIMDSTSYLIKYNYNNQRLHSITTSVLNWNLKSSVVYSYTREGCYVRKKPKFLHCRSYYYFMLDTAGRVILEKKVIGGEIKYTTQVKYDEYGRIIWEKHTDGEFVEVRKYEYKCTSNKLKSRFYTREILVDPMLFWLY